MGTNKSEIQALKALKGYSGENPYLLQLHRDIISEGHAEKLTEFSSEYILKNVNAIPRTIGKTAKISDWFGKQLQDKYEIEFIPDKLVIYKYYGDTKTTYHVDCKWRKSMNPIGLFIPKKALLTNVFVEDYHNYPVDFNRYNNLLHMKDASRTLKPHQEEAVQFLLSRKNCILADDMGLGKMQPLSTLIPTPTGFRRLGSLEIGDYVFTQSGEKTKITEIYEHKDKEIYRVTFSDGTSAECGLEHLWVVKDNKSKKDKWITLSLKEILQNGLEFKPGIFGKNKEMKPRYEIPLLEKGIDYQADSFTGNGNPLILGQYLGNLLSDNEQEDGFAPAENGLDDTETPNTRCYIEPYLKRQTAEFRDMFLQGMMSKSLVYDSKRDEYVFECRHEQLKDDIVELFNSLGKVVEVSYHLKYAPEYILESCRKKIWHISIAKEQKRYITCVEYLRNDDARCIKVEDKSGTYITGRNYIVTHNTTSLSVGAIEGNFDSILIICPAGLKNNWKNELMWFVPEKDITVIDSYANKNKEELEQFLGYGAGKSGKNLAELRAEAKDKGKWRDNRFVIVNYDILDEFYKPTMARSEDSLRKLTETSPMFKYIYNKKSLIIIDEAHNLSNSKSDRFKLIKNFVFKGKPDCLWLATGTPITNHPDNFYNLLVLTGDPIADDWEYYMSRYCDSKKFPAKGEKEKWTNIFLRNHNKSSWYQLTDVEKMDLKMFIRNNARMITVAKGESNLDELRERTAHLYLRRTKDDLGGLPNKTVHECFYDLTMDQMLEYNRLWDEYEAEKKAETPDKELNKDLIEGAVYRKYCSNLMIPNTIGMTDKFIANGEKVVIMCCYDEELYSLKEYYGGRCVIYNGKTNLKEKDNAVKRFMNDDDVMVFIGNMAAASVGITLISSHIMIFNNMQYVPSGCRQAEDRIYRIGQKDDCDIYYQIYRGTEYEKIWNTVLKKELCINQVIKKEGEK